MKKLKRPMLSAEDIELKAEEVIAYFSEQHSVENPLNRIMPTPLQRYMEIMKDDFNIIYNSDSDLGNLNNKLKILGQFTFKPLGIFIDKSLKNDRRFLFTLGHEIGHLVLHRKELIDMEEYNIIKDTQHDFKTGKKVLTTSRDWIEWQANLFSSALILPRATFAKSLRKVQAELEIKRNIGIVFLTKENYSLRDYKNTVGRLAELYNVSGTNIECRLKDLSLLIDKREFDPKHISALLRSG